MLDCISFFESHYTKSTSYNSKYYLTHSILLSIFETFQDYEKTFSFLLQKEYINTPRITLTNKGRLLYDSYKFQNTHCLFVDESGDPGIFPTKHREKHPFFTYGFAYVKNPKNLNVQLKRYLKKIHKKGIYPKEIKELKFSTNKSVLGKFGYGANDIKEFMKNDDKIRMQVLSIIKKNTDHVYASILNKKSINRTTWTPETIGNFMFNRSLFDHIFPNLHTIIPPKIIIDAGRLSGKKLNSFYEYMDKSESYRAFTKKKKYSGFIDNIQTVNSTKKPGIWAADMIAGSVKYSFLYNDAKYYDIIKNKMLTKPIIFWE